jgi:nucleoside-diphosphate-sugar epimerase
MATPFYWGKGFTPLRAQANREVRLLRSNFERLVNIGSEEMVTIDQLVEMVADIAGKRIEKVRRGCAGATQITV